MQNKFLRQVSFFIVSCYYKYLLQKKVCQHVYTNDCFLLVLPLVIGKKLLTPFKKNPAKQKVQNS